MPQGDPFYDLQMFIMQLDITHADKLRLTGLAKAAVKYAAGDAW